MKMGQYGHGKKTTQGGCSEYSVVPEKFLYQIKRDIGKSLFETKMINYTVIGKRNLTPL